MYYLGIDIGGMSIKAGIVDSCGNILCKQSVETIPFQEASLIVDDIVNLCKNLVSENNFSFNDILGIGVGVPGSVYDQKGIIRFTCNINLTGVNIVKDLQSRLGVGIVKATNDANCAVLAESLFGAARGAKNIVLITIGTGIGTGIIVDGKLLTGNRSAGSEGGHINVNFNGTTCGCGKKGHYESYASATALKCQTEAVAKKYPDSLVAKMVKEEGVCGRIIFIAAKKGDRAGQNAVKRYIKYIALGLVSFVNIFYPEVIIIGGGVSNEGDNLIKPLQRYVSRNKFGASYNPYVKVVGATLKNDAGIIGAAALTMNFDEKF